MAKPLVAIVGRPNVGKSTLFNRILGERFAIVEDLPGTTRDRLYADADWNGKEFTVVDTGGLMAEDEMAGSTTEEIVRATQEQALVALREADVIVFVVDGEHGLSSGDMDVADLLRRTEKPVVLAVNKTESQVRQDNAVEFYALGIGEPYPVSSIHGQGVGDLLDEIANALPESFEGDEPDHPRIALVGRPNVGKSAILNSILGQGRHIVSSIPGTTRDSVDSLIEWKSTPLTLVDTAGVRRRGKIERGVEKYSVLRSMRAIDRCDVAVLVLDASEPFTAQDQHVAGYVVERNKGLIIVVNKWDLVEKDDRTMGRFVNKAREEFDFVPWAPLLFTSALSGQRVSQILEIALTVVQERQRRISTGELNRLLRDIVHHHPPPSRPGKWVRFYYATQATINPPTFVFFCNEPENVHFSYRRYIENEIREEHGFLGTPIVLRFRRRAGRE